MLEFNYYVVQLRPFSPKIMAGFTHYQDADEYLYRLSISLGNCPPPSLNRIETEDGYMFMVLTIDQLQLLKQNKLKI